MKSKVRLWSLVVLILVLLFLILFPARVGTAAERTNVAAPNPAGGEMTANYFKLPLSFEANQGQTDARVKFLSRGSGYTLFLTGNEAVLSLRKSEVRSQKSAEERASKFEKRKSVVRSLRPTPSSQLASSEPRVPSPESSTPAVLHMKLMGANPAAKVVGLDELPGKSNYFLGNDPNKWRTNVPTYARVKYANVYPGVDVVYYGNQQQLEYDFVVAPGADPKAITLVIETENTKLENRNPKIEASGDLVISTDAGEVRFRKPAVYQPALDSAPRTDRLAVEGKFVLLASNRIGFEVPSYDKTKPLVIDPTLVYSTFIGDRGARSIAVDSSGAVYLTGIASRDFPVINPYQPDFGGGGDAFVAKLNAAGSALVYSTFLGGQDRDIGLGIAVDAAGSAYVTGKTRSPNFPRTDGAFQASLQPGVCGTPPGLVPCSDLFVTALNATGNGLIYSTYLGGTGDEDQSEIQGNKIAVDSAGNAYVTGDTMSSDFPTAGDVPTAYAGGICGTQLCPDVIVTKLAPDGSPVYSRYLGGTSWDRGLGIAVDPSGGAYIVGMTVSTDFPTTLGALQSRCAGQCQDAFVTKLDPAGGIVYSARIGGDDSGRATRGEGIAVDATGNAYITGSTNSTTFPTVNAFQPHLSSGWCVEYDCDDEFVTKLNPEGSALVYSTYLGGSGGEHAPGIAVDSSGAAYVAGGTFITDDFPMANPIQGHYGGGTCGEPPDTSACFDGTVSKLSPSGGLVFSTYLGGPGDDAATSVAVDASGGIYVTGSASVAGFPITPGAFQETLLGGSGAFVAKISLADNTPTGADVDVKLTNIVALTFQSVGTPGTTAVTRTDTGPAPPAGFNLGDPPAYYELSTTATFTGSITVCINYSGISFGDELNLKLLHFEGAGWIDRTTSLDTTNKILCAAVTSLSPFVVLQPPYLATIQPPVEPDGSSVFNVKRGVVPVKFTLAAGGTPTCALPPATISLARTAGVAAGPIDESIYLMASDAGSNFRIAGCQYEYNLGTKALGPGTYQVNIFVGNVVVGSAMFGLR